MKCLGILILISSSFGFERNNKPFEARIWGGKATSIENNPYQLSLCRGLCEKSSSKDICGAVLLTSRVALTAAHCVERHTTDGLPLTPSLLQIRAGSEYTDRDGIVVDVESFAKHPNYIPFPMGVNDIAILILAQKLEFSKKIQPVPLPSGNFDVKEGLVGHVSGWGIGSNDSKLLNVVEVPVSNHLTCMWNYFFSSTVVSHEQFCVGYDESGKGSCPGDSGGPFVSQGVLLGIVSKGSRCDGLPASYAIYTKVSAHLDFIVPYLN